MWDHHGLHKTKRDHSDCYDGGRDSGDCRDDHDVDGDEECENGVNAGFKGFNGQARVSLGCRHHQQNHREHHNISSMSRSVGISVY